MPIQTDWSDLDGVLQERFAGRYTRVETTRAQHAGLEGHHHGAPPDAVLFAESLADVQAAVRFCAARRIPIIPHGAGTSLEGHLSAAKGGLCIDLTRLDKVLEVSPENLLCRVEAGVTREQLNTHLRASGLFFPIDPGANATLGGMASTRASGTNAVRYGTMRDVVASAQVVLANGEVIETGTRAAKSAAGYDLTGLFVGAEGTLGIVTALSLRLFGIPEAIAAATCAFSSLAGAVDTVIALMQMGAPMARIELLDEHQIAAVNRYSNLDLAVAPTLAMEFHGSPAAVAEQRDIVQAIAEENGGGPLTFAEDAEDRTRLWKARHDAYFATKATRPGAVVWTSDVCVPIAELADSILATRAAIDAAGVQATIVGHVGDGNYHVLFVLDPGAPEAFAQVAEINRRMVDRAIDVGGTCTGEHGVGQGKREMLLRERGAHGMAVMRAIKAALDPLDLMNPGKIFLDTD